MCAVLKGRPQIQASYFKFSLSGWVSSTLLIDSPFLGIWTFLLDFGTVRISLHHSVLGHQLFLSFPWLTIRSCSYLTFGSDGIVTGLGVIWLKDLCKGVNFILCSSSMQPWKHTFISFTNYVTVPPLATYPVLYILSNLAFHIAGLQMFKIVLIKHLFFTRFSI